MVSRFFLMTGFSCGGNSTLLEALGQRGFATVPEPGRRIVTEEIAGDDKALPWVDLRVFAQRALKMARSDLEAAHRFEGNVFFDRGLVDAAVALEHLGGPPVGEILGETHAYAERVFVFPPWQKLFAEDAERRHDFDAAVQEYHQINHSSDSLGYIRHVLPQASVSERVELVLTSCRAN